MPNAFYPKWERRASDGGFEASINHYDSEDALSQLKSDKALCRYGIARFRSAVLCKVNRSPHARDNHVKIERSPDEMKGNRYHGNIVYPGTLAKDHIKILAALFANDASLVQ